MTCWSHTRLSAFEQCPFKYYLQYVEKRKSPVQGIEGFMGNRVHEALQRLYEGVMKGKILGLKEVLEFYAKRWEEKYHPHVRVVKQDTTPEDYFNEGISCIEWFYRAHHPFDRGTTLAVEKRVYFSTSFGDRFRAVMDRVDLEDNKIVIHDYKTGGKLSSKEDLAADRQLSLYYRAAEQSIAEGRPIELRWHFLRYGKMISLSGSEMMVEEVEKQVHQLIEVIESTDEYPPKLGPRCPWCGYSEMCPVYQDG